MQYQNFPNKYKISVRKDDVHIECIYNLLLEIKPCVLGSRIRDVKALQMFTGHYGLSAGFPCCGETLQFLQIAGKSYNYHGVSLQSVNITGFTHNIHRVSLYFLQPFSIAGKTCNLFFCFQGVFLKILSLCMVNIQEQFLIKSGL